MSKAMKGALLFIILILFLAIILTIQGRAVRNNENTNALVEAIETSLQNVMEQKAYSIHDSDEFVADFLETLLVKYDTDSKITVKILKQDIDKGLLSVEVDETYTHPNGSTGTVSVQRTVIFDKKVVATEIFHTINYMVDGHLYKSYQILDGDALIIPKDPVSLEINKTFDYWYCKETDSKWTSNMISDQDYNFDAYFK